MECTQRLECSQDLCNTQIENTNIEQIGYLGICGMKYPVKRGPNKIGRDSQTCNIVLNLNSVSRQHAVINILNKKDFMLMDLDSANKTKLIDKTLQPYIPYTLKSGDTIQLGQVFGIFRLLDDENDLPMTQAIEIPETPVASKFVSRLNNGTATTIPESPDVSDKEDSFLIASQSKPNIQMKNMNNVFIKPSLGAKKTIYANNKTTRNSTSVSIQLEDSNNSFNDSSHKPNEKTDNHAKDDIFNMETQVPESQKDKEKSDSIYTAETQIPSEVPLIHCLETQAVDTEHIKSTEHEKQSIYNLETQMPDVPSPNIHSLETQMPDSGSSNVPLNKSDIHNCDTQIPTNIPNSEDKSPVETDKDKSIYDALTQVIPLNPPCQSNNKVSCVDNNMDNELIEFDGLNTQSFDDVFSSPPLLPKEQLDNIEDRFQIIDQETEKSDKVSKDLPQKDDIHNMATQKIPTENDDDITDCEDDIFEDCEIPNQHSTDCTKNREGITKFQVISDKGDGEDFQNILTQVVAEDNTVEEKNIGDLLTQKICEPEIGDQKDDFGDVLTQKIDEVDIYNLPTQLIEAGDSSNMNKANTDKHSSPFKVPLSVNKVKKVSKLVDSPTKIMNVDFADESPYYKQTQDIVDDLCTQRLSPDIKIMESILSSKKSIQINLGSDDELVANTGAVEKKSIQYKNETSPTRRYNTINQINYTTNGSSSKVALLTKMPSDLSDVEVTPKKINSKFMNTDLPDSQEIKTCITLQTRLEVCESSSESESEKHDSDEGTPITFKGKRKRKSEVKKNLTKKFDVSSLPDRVMTRHRKPTIKIQESIEYGQVSKNILRSNLLGDEENIDSEILKDNIARLKNSAKHSKHGESKKVVRVKKEPVDTLKPDEIKKPAVNLNIKEESKKIRVKKEKKVSDKTEARKSVNTSDNKSIVPEECGTSIVRTRRQKAQIMIEDDTTMIQPVSTVNLQPIIKKEECTQKSKKEALKPSNSNDSTTKTRPKRGSKKETPKDDSSPEIKLAVRRSKRQKNVKESTDKKPKRETSKNETVRREQSTVYNLSSESMNDSTRSLKRSFTGEIEALSAKRPRSIPNTSKNSSQRSTPAIAGKIQHVLFTAFPCEEVKLKLEHLGAVIVTDVTKCTVLLTMQIKRTFKLLCAVGLGVPIVGLNWVQACVDTKMLVDPWLYVMKDETAEKRFTFSLEKTLTGNKNFLKGYNISATPKVLPTAAEMKLIVECSGGVWKESGSNWICVSTIADKPLWPALRKKGATIVSTEFILGGVLRQKADVQTNMFK